MKWRDTRNRVALGLACACLLFSGCGNRMSPVRGTVTLEDGSPLTKGLVVFEGQADGKPVMARGEIKSDGSYELGMSRAPRTPP